MWCVDRRCLFFMKYDSMYLQISWEDGQALNPSSVFRYQIRIQAPNLCQNDRWVALGKTKQVLWIQDFLAQNRIQAAGFLVSRVFFKFTPLFRWTITGHNGLWPTHTLGFYGGAPGREHGKTGVASRTWGSILLGPLGLVGFLCSRNVFENFRGEKSPLKIQALMWSESNICFSVVGFFQRFLMFTPDPWGNDLMWIFFSKGLGEKNHHRMSLNPVFLWFMVI